MTYAELLAAVKRSSMQEIVASGTDDLQACLSLGCSFFERYTHADQMTAMACMIGMILATLEGEKLVGESNLGVIITHKERLEIWHAQVMQVFKEAMAARGMPINDHGDTHQEALDGSNRGGGKTRAGRIINITSGKRKRKPHTKRL